MKCLWKHLTTNKIYWLIGLLSRIRRWAHFIAWQILGICMSNPCAYEQFIMLLASCLSTFYPISTYSITSTMNVKNVFQFNPKVEIYNLKCICTNMPKNGDWNYTSLALHSSSPTLGWVGYLINQWMILIKNTENSLDSCIEKWHFTSK